MRKLLLLFLLCAPSAWATNAVFVSNAGAGAQDGLACATAKPASYFNTSGNWSATPSGIQIGPDTTVHLCGTISTTLTAQGSGSSGHPIIIFFESAAKLQQMVCPSTGCLNLDSRTDITVDGGGTTDSFGHLATPNGIIQSTANGSSLPSQIMASRCAEADNSTRVTFQNIVIANCYVHTLTSDTVPSAPDPTGIHATGASTFKVLHSILHDMNWAIYTGLGGNTIEVGWDEIYNIDHALAVGVIAQTTTGVQLHDSHIHDTVNWDTTATACSGSPCYHHDGIHDFVTPGGGGHIYQIQIWNNLFDGDWGLFNTAMVFTELTDGTQTGWNNLFIGTGGPGTRNLNNGFICSTVGSSGTSKWYNNTVLASSSQVNSDVKIEGVNADFRNNLINGGSVLFEWTPALTFISGGFDFNDFVNGSGTSYYNGSFQTYSAMNTHFGGSNANSITPTTLGVNASGVPQTGFPGALNATNLTSLSMSTLDSDTSAGASRASVSRPSTGNWDIGAYAASGSGTAPSIPGSLTVSVSLNNASLSWNASTGTATITYNVKRGTTSGGPYTTVGTTTSTTFSDNGLANGTYFWVVSATNVVGTSGNSNQVTATINLTPALTLTPSPVAFGSQQVSTTSTPITVSVSNTGTGTEIFSTPHFTLTDSTNFLRTGGSCLDSGNIPAGSNCTDIFACKPTVAGALSSTLTITGTVNGTDTLTCTGTNPPVPVVQLGPRTTNFGNVNTGTTSAPTTYTLQNTGTAILNITSIVSSDVTQFPLSANTCGSTLAPSASCTFNDSFAPGSGGTQTATISVTTNASTSPDTISLQGNGVVPVVQPPPAPTPVIFIGANLPPQPIIGNVTVSTGCALNSSCNYVMSCSQCSASTQLLIDGSQISQTYLGGTMSFTATLTAGAHSYLAVNLQ